MQIKIKDLFNTHLVFSGRRSACYRNLRLFPQLFWFQKLSPIILGLLATLTFAGSIITFIGCSYEKKFKMQKQKKWL